MLGVPIDDGGEQIEAGHSEVLSFAGAVADFALTANSQGVLHSLMRLALIETDLGTALRRRAEQAMLAQIRAAGRRRPLEANRPPECIRFTYRPPETA